MKNTTTQLAILLMAIMPSASASTITVIGSDAEFGLLDAITYTLQTIGNNSIGSQTGFTPASGQATLATSTGVSYTGYLSSVPVGATLTGATLDFAGLFSGQTYGSTVTGGTFFYQPTFASTLSAYMVTITSTLANTIVSGSSATGFNLWPLFQNDILAGNNITVNWGATDTFTANNSTYANSCKNCTETFNVTDTANFSASSTSNALNLTFNVTSTPEPATMGLAGFVLLGLGVVGRRGQTKRS